jgi:hypothetical protein
MLSKDDDAIIYAQTNDEWGSRSIEANTSAPLEFQSLEEYLKVRINPIGGEYVKFYQLYKFAC